MSTASWRRLEANCTSTIEPTICTSTIEPTIRSAQKPTVRRVLAQLNSLCGRMRLALSGYPQLGQVVALSETSGLHSVNLINTIEPLLWAMHGQVNQSP